MKSKFWAILVAVLLVAGIVIGIVIPSLKKPTDEKEVNYNIIFANSTVPPTLAAMDSIIDGGDTYANIQRGKTYSGIAELENQGFKNFSFDTSKQENNLTPDKVQDMVDLIKRLKSKNSKATFNIYVTDFDAYAGFAIGIYAGLDDKDYKVVMIEDGSSTYNNFRNYFITGKTAGGGVDEPFTAFETLLTTTNEVIANMKEDAAGSLPGAEMMFHNPYAVYALATLDNAEYRVQNKNNILNDLQNNVADSRLTAIYNGTDSTYSVNINSSSVSATMAKFNEIQKEKYLTLVLGTYRTDATAMLTRTKDLNDANVSSKKLVFIGSRVYGYDYGLIPDLTESNYSNYIVDYSALQTLAGGGDALASLLTEQYLESDWQVLKALMPISYDEAYTAAFNFLQEYRYTFSWTLDIYGGTDAGKFDVLYKGHPSELVDTKSTFQAKHYKTSGGVPFNEEMFALVNSFHFNDSVGKKIGVLPGGVSVENFAFLGLDFSICGLDSSAYTGFEPSVPVEFVMGGGNYNVYSGNLVGRYNAGTLLNENGETTLVMSKGNILKALGRNEEAKSWIRATFGIVEADMPNYDIDRTGLLVYSNEYKTNNSLVDNKIRRNVSFGHLDATGNFVEDYKVENVENGDFLSDVSNGFNGEVPEGFTFVGWAYEGTSYVWNSYFNTTNEDIKLFAVFTSTVTFNSNYPTGSNLKNVTATQTIYKNWTNNLQTISSLGFSVEGYQFKGWTTSANSTDVFYVDAADAKNLSGNQTLYAIWEIIAENP